MARPDGAKPGLTRVGLTGGVASGKSTVAALLRGLGTTSGGGGLADIGVPVAIMLGFGALMLAASRLVPDRGALS